MTQERKAHNRELLIDAATRLLESQPADELSLRAVCAAVGVQMPTLYHYFGSKQGLLDAVTTCGFDDYLAEKLAQPGSADTIDDIRQGWDHHVSWGLAHPAVYALMWKPVPGRRTPAAERALEALVAQTRRAEREGRLVVPAVEAAEHVLASCVGATLFQITAPALAPSVSEQIRDATLAAIGGALPAEGESAADLARHLSAALRHARPVSLTPQEQALLLQWLNSLAGVEDRV